MPQLVSEASAATRAGAQAFWSQFRTAVLHGDLAAVQAMTVLPLPVVSDGGGFSRQISRAFAELGTA